MVFGAAQVGSARTPRFPDVPGHPHDRCLEEFRDAAELLFCHSFLLHGRKFTPRKFPFLLQNRAAQKPQAVVPSNKHLLVNNVYHILR